MSVLALAALLAGSAQAQTTAPAKAASAAGGDQMVGNTPSEAMQRQALSPYRFILNAAPNKPAAKPVVAAAPAAPAAPAPVAAAAPVRHNTPSAAPVVAKSATAPNVAAAEPAKPSGSAVAAAPAPTTTNAPAAGTTAGTNLPAMPAPASTAPSAAPILVAAATVPSPAAQMAAPLPSPAQVAKRELVPLQQDPPVLSKALLAEIPQGHVKVRFDVNPDGSTSGVQVASSSNRKLNGPTITAVSKWRFQPIDATRSAEIEVSFNNE